MALRLKCLAVVGICLSLAGCSSNTERQTANIAFDTVTSRFNQPEPSRVEFTRADLVAAGVDAPLIVARLSVPDPISAGLVIDGENQGVLYWRAGDDGIIKTKSGVLTGTVGTGFDLYSAESGGTIRALSSQSQGPYYRTHRHLNVLNKLDITRFECRMAPPERETIVVFDRSHAVLRFVETCVAEMPNAAGEPVEAVNTFWRDVNRSFVWKSDQWISEQTGNVTIERVIE